MVKPTLLVLAAGMGSRYGSLKQMDGVGPNNEAIIDYSIYDAIRAGFGKVVFVIRHSFAKEFTEVFNPERFGGKIEVEFVYQELDYLPEGFTVPEGREKPWGTNHALMMAAEAIHEPFAVINADDFYGRDAFKVIAEDLMRPRDRKGDYCMVGFRVGNTMTENGSVARGVCENKDGFLSSVVERTAISYDKDHNIVFTDENGNIQTIAPNTPVSMNLWGFTPDYFDYSEREFKRFLDRDINTPKAEYFIPLCIDALINNGEATVKVLDTDSKWFGVTYAADRPGVVEKFAELHREGVYPSPLFKKA